MQSLKELCLRVLCSHVSAVHDVGQVPFELILPMLRMAAAEQLQRIERASPHIALESDPVWQSLCLRDFSTLADQYGQSDKRPPSGKTWRELYAAEKEAERQRMERARAHLKRRFEEIEDEKKGNALVVIREAVGTKRRPSKAPSHPETIAERARATSRQIMRMKEPPAPARSSSPLLVPSELHLPNFTSKRIPHLPSVTTQLVTRRMPLSSPDNSKKPP